MTNAQEIKGVILDLDGLMLDTEVLCCEVASVVLDKYGKRLNETAQKNALGKRPYDAWASLCKDLEVDADPQQLLDESEPLLLERLPFAKLLPGALRLVRHLASIGVPYAVGTSTPRATFNRKMEAKEELRGLLKVVVCGDEVANGKPRPDIFLAAAAKIGIPPAQCLVLEDAPSGIRAALAAGMRAVLVPSARLNADLAHEKETAEKDGSTEEGEKAAETDAAAVASVGRIKSLLDFKPDVYGLPPFSDVLEEEVIPLLDEPIRIRGPVVKGFGRGSKDLGIPTANVDPDALGSCLSESVSGIYCGWASIGDSDEVYKMVMSIGWNPFFGNCHKTAEPWILHDFKESFYGKEIRLLVVGYLRPEANFTSLEALIDRIHRDADVSKRALEHPVFAPVRIDPFLKP